MENSPNSNTLSNPDTYLNYFPPDQLAQFEVARNFYLAILGAAIWDVLAYIPDDVRIVCKGLNAVTFCFIFSRVFSITYAFLFIINQTHPVEFCAAMAVSMQATCILAMTCSSFLFLRRLHAVYANSRLIRWAFTLLWLGVFTCGISTFFGTHVRHIPGTNYCGIYGLDSYVSIVEYFPAAFDTVVFFAISYRLVTTHSLIDEEVSWRSVITGKALPRLSRALLYSGQQYYLIVFGVTIVSGTILYTPSVSPIYRALMTLASVALTSSMACRVFRNLKTFEDAPQSSFLPTMSAIAFDRAPPSEDKKDKSQRPPPQETVKFVSYPTTVIRDSASQESASNTSSQADLPLGSTASQSHLAQLANEAMLMGSAGVVFGR